MSEEREMTDDEIVAMLKPGSLAHQLWIAALAAKPIEPRAKPAPGDPSTRKRFEFVRPSADEPRSKLHAASERRRVMDWVAARLEQPTAMSELEEAFGRSVRGHVQKLVVTGHLIVEAAKQ